MIWHVPSNVVTCTQRTNAWMKSKNARGQSPSWLFLTKVWVNPPSVDGLTQIPGKANQDGNCPLTFFLDSFTKSGRSFHVNNVLEMCRMNMPEQVQLHQARKEFVMRTWFCGLKRGLTHFLVKVALKYTIHKNDAKHRGWILSPTDSPMSFNAPHSPYSNLT